MARNVLEYLEKSAALYSDKIAVIESDKSVTYKGILEISKALGSALLKEVSQKEPVGVFMEKGIDALASFFGTVYAGAFYSLLNPGLPESRLNQICDTLKLKVIITDSEHYDQAAASFSDIRILKIDELKTASVDEAGLQAVRDKMVDTNPLYVNFTSGSTGVPKGIVVAHRSVVDFIECFTDIFDITGDDIIANQAPFDFDVSVKDIYSAIKVGATLVIVPKELFSAPVKLVDYLCDNNITTMIWAVSALCLISTFHGWDYRHPEHLKKVLFSGETMPYKHLMEWLKSVPDAMYVNLYGPTEITCNCTYHILDRDRNYENGIPIGKAFPNEDVFLIDSEGNCVKEPGATGEIVVRGTALALGYYNMPEQSAARFVQNPCNTMYPELVYKTGDIGSFNEAGEFMFHGRVDNQIKHLGHRIELEEIEHAIGLVDGVERCFCVYDEKKSRLKAYYVGTIEKKDLHQELSSKLPVFMVPGYIRQIENIYLTKNGKTDRKRTMEEIEGK